MAGTNPQSWEAAGREAAAEGKAFAVILSDIDRMKRIVDDHGRATSDLVLDAACELLDRVLPPEAQWARRGQEFQVLLPAADTHDAVEIADSVRLAWEPASELDVRWEGLPHFSAGFGVGVAAPEAADRFLHALRSAGLALYVAKQNGGGNTVADQPWPTS
jgi:diguanylate cyclase (GGDEF)-like protein